MHVDQRVAHPSKHRERKIGGHLVERFHRQHLVARTHGHAFCPAAGGVGQRHPVDAVTVGLPAATVSDHVDLEEARWRIAPVGEGADRDAASDDRARILAAFALTVVCAHAFANMRSVVVALT
ncbi:hypothetical protein P3T23_006496 [Paraburkholderia sp. GAS448]|uniref:hypothetical protein n=1 Tax=Paraburkholderia sp. GAS448 TaxID=3035136 RepID=UPI003D1F05EA